MIMISSLKKIQDKFQELNITTQSNRVDLTAQVFGTSVKFTANGDNYDIEYIINDKRHKFEDQPFKGDIGNIKLGVYMFFERLENNLTPGTKYYGRLPNYSPYATEGQGEEALHKAIKRMSQLLSRRERVITNLKEESIALRETNKQKQEEIERLQGKVNTLESNINWFEKESMKGIGELDTVKNIYVPMSIEIEE